MVDATTALDKMAKKSSKKHNGPSAKITDARFANIQTDPRFKLPSKTAGRTKIDSRFSRMLKDDEFIASAKVDKYGRRLKSDNKKKALQYLYTEEDEEEEEKEEEEEEEEGDDEPDDDELVMRELQKVDAIHDPARGGGFSSSDSESDEEEDDEAEAAGEAGKPEGSMQKLRDEQADVEVGEITKRIAIVNLDWDHIKSIDLMSLFSSFVPKGGEIKRVSIFPSEFGKERMQNEELEGPPRDIFKKKTEDEEEEEEEEDSEDDSEDGGDEDDEDVKKEDIIEEGEAKDFDSDALRAYQLDRLRYYYAVMECSDEATAEAIYKATDGTEYQSSSNFLDLRFVPDEVTFDDEPRDSCDALPSGYRPAEFVTDALQHSRVKLTWDLHPDEAQRREKIQRAFAASKSELEEEDLHAYLASDSDDDDEPQEQQDVADPEPKLTKKELARQKMRAALGLGPEPGKASQSGASGEMEMTFTPGESDAEEKRPKPAEEEETTIEKYMRKEREKKAKRKEKAVAKREAASAADANEDAAMGQNVDLGFDDPFFTTEEPTKPSKHSQKKEERLRKRQQRQAEAAESAKQKAQLEQIMAEGSGEVAEHLDHFDMAEIAKAEKLKKFKNGKKGKQKELAKLDGLQDNFKMDVGDERFKAVFESHEFAIDPSDPKFKATPGMKMLLEEGRKKRGKDAEEGGRSSKKARRH